MSKQTINIGASPNDGTGTPLRTSFDYTNQNFTELYTALGGGVGLPGATTQVIFNDGGTNLAGDAGLVYNKTTDALTVAGLVTAGSATITGDLTVDTSTLKVDSANDRVGVGTAIPGAKLTVAGASEALRLCNAAPYLTFYNAAQSSRFGYIQHNGTNLGIVNEIAGSLELYTNNTLQATLNSTGLGVGVSPSYKLDVSSSSNIVGRVSSSSVFNTGFNITNTTGSTWSLYSFGSNDATLQNSFGIYHQSGTSFLQITQAGNVGISVTPTAIFGGSGVNGKGLQGDSWTISSFGGSNDTYFGSNLYTSAYGVWSNRVNAASGAYYITGGTHIFYRGAAQAPGTITPTESARIDASGNLILQSSSTPPSLFANGQLTMNATSNTNLRFSYRGSDGVTRVANITLA